MKNYPKINFKYSWIYDQIWRDFVSKKEKKNYPSARRILSYIKKIEKLWRKEEKRVLQELAGVAHLNWKEKSINCYVVGKCKPFSDPLTVHIYDKLPDYFIDVLIHELIHNLFIQPGNEQKTRKAWQYFHRQYKNLPFNTRIHIPLHAIHSHIYYKFFNEKRLERDIKLISFLLDYKKSWQIVQREDYRKIIDEFAKRVSRS